MKIVGNCRMCFVEIEGIPKPVIACATLIKNGLKIYLNSILVYKSRESVLEFLLINHPLDCPVCDQGGECDLQDQFLVMGNLTSRYYEEAKKTVFDKNLSFLIKLSLNKCINCSRCVRFANDIVGDYSFSLLGRGENLEISNYSGNFYFSEISGNVVDLCPVGALTLKPTSYKMRPWEVIDVKYIDFFDIFHPPIRIDFRGLNVLRVLPLQNEDIQEE
jgi:NADH dehydrogenase/NADH:ubiquinone oxidoreductase subunit G